MGRYIEMSILQAISSRIIGATTNKRAEKMIVYTLDSETDPFLHGRKPLPFTWCLYNGNDYHVTWGEKCTQEMIDVMYHREPGLIYLHNGGKFDIFYLYHYIDHTRPLLIINGRIVECYIKCAKGFHRVRDSYKILPFALAKYDKEKIDYNKMEKETREFYKDEIIHYLKKDCEFLHQLCMGYIQQFGLAITIGTTAMKELKKFHDIGEPLNATQDETYRRNFYYGARVQCFKEANVYAGDWKVYDVNSMYPYVMATYQHPIGHPYHVDTNIADDTFFVKVKGYSRGAFPLRQKHALGGIIFPHANDVYSVSIHEYNTAMQLGLFDCEEVIESHHFKNSTTFAAYIEHYYGKRRNAKLRLQQSLDDDEARRFDLFYKYLLNNSYGKFAVNPNNFWDRRLTPNDAAFNLACYGYEIEMIIGEFDLILWRKPPEKYEYLNVATGASITGAARATLLHGIVNGENVMYCDTDSIICTNLNNLSVDAAELGAWKLEKVGNYLALGGRKMYSLFDGNSPVKFACKGGRLTPEQVAAIAHGKVVHWESQAPTFHIDGSCSWVHRDFCSTVKL